MVEGASDRSIRMDSETSPRDRRAGNLGDVTIGKRVGSKHSLSWNCHRPYFAIGFSILRMLFELGTRLILRSLTSMKNSKAVYLSRHYFRKQDDINRAMATNFGWA